MKHLCPTDAAKFRKLVNMSAREIRAWAKDPRAKCASFPETVQRLTHRQKWKGMLLPSLVELKEKRGPWNEIDCKYARRVNSFNVRMQGMVDKWGCKPRALQSLRNWGRMPPKCTMEDVDALGKKCSRRRRTVR